MKSEDNYLLLFVLEYINLKGLNDLRSLIAALIYII